MDLQLINILLCVSFLFSIVILKKTRNRSRLPPGPWKLPVIGNLHQIARGLPHESLRVLAKKHGPLMHLKLGEVSMVVISSPRLAEEVMKTKDLNFVDRPRLPGLKYSTNDYQDITFAPYGIYWRQLRKICTLNLLSAKRVQSFKSVREEETSNLIEYLSQSPSASGATLEPINLTKIIISLTNDIFSRAAFGRKPKDQQVFASATKLLLSLASGFDLADVFPSSKFFGTISGGNLKQKKIKQVIDRILESIIEEHKINKNLKNGEAEEDLVDVLLRLQQSNDLGIPITIDTIKAVTFDLFTGGSDTTSAVVDWTMSELMRHPTEMKKVQNEVRRVFHDKLQVNEARLHELSYLKAVIKESLRLHPPLPLLIPRECRETCEIMGYEIPVKTQVVVNGWAIGRDPNYWSDAEMFLPERFIGVDTDFKGAHTEYIPFGAGRRICPGILFGVANVELVLANLLYHFNWTLPRGVKPDELDMTQNFGATTTRKNDLYLVPTLYSKLPNKEE